MKIEPIDLDALKRNQKQFDPHRVAAVLADILSRELGCEIVITLTPKEPRGQLPSVDKP